MIRVSRGCGYRATVASQKERPSRETVIFRHSLTVQRIPRTEAEEVHIDVTSEDSESICEWSLARIAVDCLFQ